MNSSARFPVNRRQFLLRSGLISGAVMLGVGADAFTHGARSINVERVDVPLRRLPSSFHELKIAQLSDIHYSDFEASFLEEVVARTNQLDPDLVVLTGDFVTQAAVPSVARDRQAALLAEPCARILSKLKCPAGVFAVLGNHDQLTDPHFVVDALKSNRINVLQNEAHPIEQSGSRIWLAGVKDVLHGHPKLDLALGSIPAGDTTILLAHEPDFADEVDPERVDLQLSGHSHGGQIRFPLVGALVLPEMGTKYPIGLRRLGKLTLYTNRGIGTIGIDARLNCTPEITLFTLKPTQG
jgi:uncharacterized protein